MAVVVDDALTQLGERMRELVVVEGEHRTAMTQKDGRHCIHCFLLIIGLFL